MSAPWKQGFCWSIFTGTHFPLGAWWGWHSLEGGYIDPLLVMRCGKGNPFGVAWGDITLTGGCSSLHTASKSSMMGSDFHGLANEMLWFKHVNTHWSTYMLSVVFRLGCSISFIPNTSYSHKPFSDSSTTDTPKPYKISELLAFPAEAIGKVLKVPSSEDTLSPGINPGVLGL